MQILEMQCIWQVGIVLEIFFRMRKNNLEPWNLFPELLNCFILILIFYFLFLHTFGVELFSGQDEVRTSNLLHLPCDFLHSGLMLQQLSHLAN